MKLKILSQTKSEEHEVVWVEANTLEGNFVIQKGHAATALVLEAQKELLYGLKTGKQDSIKLEKGGILHVTPELVTALLG